MTDIDIALETQKVRMLTDTPEELIPQEFARRASLTFWRGVEQEDLDILKDGPEHAFYWETWEMIVEYARWTSEADGTEWRLAWTGGELWLYRTT